MLLDLHHDFADLRGNLVREAGAITMPKEQKPTTPETNSAAREAVARVPDNPTLANEAEFEDWAHTYAAQARRDLVQSMGTRPSVALGIR